MSWLRILIKTVSVAALGAVLLEMSEQGQIKGKASVITGNIIEIDQQKIKLHGIDTPELEQICYVEGKPWQCGLTAQRKLTQKIEGESLTCLGKERNNNDILMAECFVGRQNLNAWLVEQGWAVAERQDSRSFISHEIIAKRDRRGLYQSEFLKPSLWREAHPPALTLNNEQLMINH